MHECTECLSTEENPYSTSLCKSHQIELQMALLEDEEKWSEHYFKARQNAQQSEQATAATPRNPSAKSKACSGKKKMNCPTCENKVSNWITSKRVHNRPPRIFVICPHCGDEWQSVPNINGKIDNVFKTGKPRNPELKRVSMWLTKEQYQDARIRYGKVAS